MSKLHIGCGKRNFGPDWIHIDRLRLSHIKYFDIEKLLFGNNSIDLIYASHVIEYFDREDVVNLLIEWRRVLKPNGILRLAVPDFKQISDLYLTHKISLDKFLGPIYGKMYIGDEKIYHKTIYDENSLFVLLSNLGFSNIRLWDWHDVDHGIFDDHSQAYIPHMNKDSGTLISLNLECNKYGL